MWNDLRMCVFDYFWFRRDLLMSRGDQQCGRRVVNRQWTFARPPETPQRKCGPTKVFVWYIYFVACGLRFLISLPRHLKRRQQSCSTQTVRLFRVILCFIFVIRPAVGCLCNTQPFLHQNSLPPHWMCVL